MSARWLLSRSCAAATLLLGFWCAGSWVLDPRLPVVTSPSDQMLPLFPMLSMQVSDFSSGKLQAVPLAIYAITSLALVLSAALAFRLALRSNASPAIRHLRWALILSSLAVVWFWYLRELAPWKGSFRDWRDVLDPLAMMSGFLALAALVACYRVYPEPLTQELVGRGVDATRHHYLKSAPRKRAGAGVWRLWSWLPSEMYGAYGRTLHPEVHGWRRFLRSRELIWLIVVVLMLAVAQPLTSWFDDWGWAGAIVWVALASGFVTLADPVAGVRVDEALLGAPQEAVVRIEMGLHRLLGSPLGLVGIALLGWLANFCWQYGNVGVQEISIENILLSLFGTLLILSYALLLSFHAVSLLYLNWRHGASEHRRAIAWIFLGTGTAAALWLIAVIAVGTLGLVEWLLGTSTASQRQGLLGATIVLGPPLIVLAHLVSLWLSVLYRGSFDPGLALRRGTSIAILGMVLTALFVALEGALSSQLVVRFGMPDGAGALIAGTVVALAFGPVRGRVDRTVNRGMQRWLPVEALVPGEQQRLAVLFADLLGFARLSEIDEAEALQIAATLHETARAAAEMHGGHLVKTIGDTVLLTFDNEKEAVVAAIALHRQYADAVAERDLEALPMHSGLHVGDVVQSASGDVFGGVVNLARRLQSLGGPGEVVATIGFETALQNAGLGFDHLAARRFKHVTEPVKCLRARIGD